MIINKIQLHDSTLQSSSLLQQSSGLVSISISLVLSAVLGSYCFILSGLPCLVPVLGIKILLVAGLCPGFSCYCSIFCFALIIILVEIARPDCDIIVNLYQLLALNSIYIMIVYLYHACVSYCVCWVIVCFLLWCWVHMLILFLFWYSNLSYIYFLLVNFGRIFLCDQFEGLVIWGLRSRGCFYVGIWSRYLFNIV